MRCVCVGTKVITLSLRLSVSPSLRLSVSPSLRLSVSPSLRLCAMCYVLCAIYRCAEPPKC